MVVHDLQSRYRQGVPVGLQCKTNVQGVIYLPVQVLPAGRYRSVIQSCFVKSRKIHLFKERKFCAFKFNQQTTPRSAQLREQIFLSHSF